MNFFKQHNIFVKLLSLLIAIFLWSFVVLSENPPKTKPFSGKVVEPSGIEALEERGLTLVNATEAKINVSVTGTSKEMISLTANDITATVDFSGIQEAGVYYIQPSIAVAKQYDSISYQPRRLQFTVEQIVSRDIPVRVTTRNDLPKDKLIDQLTPSQETLHIRGAESVVSTVSYALLTVDLDGISKDMTQACRATLYTNEDALVDSALVTPEKENLDVEVKLNYIASVPLNVVLISAPELTRDMVEAQIEPKTVRVFGAKNVIGSLQMLSLGSIDLKDVQQDAQEIHLTIKLPAGVKLAEGEPESARVKVGMKADVKRTLSVLQVALTDQSSQEQKPEVSMVSGALSVEVQGRADIISQLNAADIQVKAVFDSAALGTGVHTIPVQVSAEQAGVSVLSKNLTINVSISEHEEIKS